MSVMLFSIIMIVLFIAIFLISGAIGEASCEEKPMNDELIFLWFIIITLFVVILFNNPYYELRDEIKRLIPKLTESQLKNIGPALKEIYKEIKLQEYKKKIEKDFNERK